MQTIVELPEFQKRVSSRLSAEEKVSLINYLAAHPASGDLIRETGGLRKLRWAAKGKGEKANLSKAERNELAKLTEILKSTYGGSHE